MSKIIGMGTCWKPAVPIESNGKDTCLYCGVKVTVFNKAEWDAITPDGKAQPMCKSCDQRTVAQLVRAPAL